MLKPGYLSNEASAKWDELAPHLESMGLLSAADGDLLAAYCECFSRWRRVAELAAKSPPVFKRKQKAEDGAEPEVVFVRNPLWSQVRDAEAALRVLAREYGFTPSARAGMRAEAGLSHAAERLLNGDRY